MILHLSPRGFWYQTVLQSTIQGVYYGLVSYDGWVKLWFCFMSSRQDYRRFVWIFVWIFPASSGCSTVASRRVRRAITFACQSMVLPIA